MGAASYASHAQSALGVDHSGPRTKITINTDIGDDIDDAFAIALAVRSPEPQVVDVSAFL
jgi:hypothetical protein